MARKFIKLIENTIERYSNGGFLTGDLVKLAGNYKSKESYKELPEQQKEYIDNYFDSDNNYYIVNIKTSKLTSNPSVNDNRGDKFTVEVARELANGRYDNQGKVTLDADLLDRIDTGINRHPVPDSQKYKNKVQIDPVETTEEDEIEITRVTAQGGTVKKSELTLPQKNTRIPSSNVTSSPAVGDTRNYM